MALNTYDLPPMPCPPAPAPMPCPPAPSAPGWPASSCRSAPVPGSQAAFVPSAPVAPAPIPHDAATQNARKGPDLATAEGYMAHQADIIEQLQARLLEGARHIQQHAFPHEEAYAWRDAVVAEFAPAQPAPGPYAYAAGNLRDKDGEIVAAIVAEGIKQADATGEFLALACNMHAPLVEALRDAIKRGGMGVNVGQLWRDLYLKATGEALK